MANVRQIELDDLKDIEYICRMTAGQKAINNADFGKVISKMFSTYYVRECRETSFCLTDDNNKAVGYILCEPDYKRYFKKFRKIDAPEIFKLNKKSGLESYLMPFPYLVLGKKYPAHLHIDILPEYQNKGYGKILMEILLKRLKEKNIKSVCLITGAFNVKAIRFYERLGFKKIISFKEPYIMGKEI